MQSRLCWAGNLRCGAAMRALSRPGRAGARYHAHTPSLQTRMSSSAFEGQHNNILIFHDGENCPIPIHHPLQRDPGPKVQGHLIVEGVIRTALSLVEGPAGYIRNYQEDCAVRYKLFNKPLARTHEDAGEIDGYWIDMVKSSLYRYSSLRIRNQLVSAGVELIDPGSKKDAVDLAILRALDQADRDFRDTEKRERTLIVLVSGDKDFCGKLRDLRAPCHGLPGFKVACIFDAFSGPNLDIKAALGEKMASGTWGDIINRSVAVDSDTALLHVSRSASGAAAVEKPGARADGMATHNL